MCRGAAAVRVGATLLRQRPSPVDALSGAEKQQRSLLNRLRCPGKSEAWFLLWLLWQAGLTNAAARPAPPARLFVDR